MKVIKISGNVYMLQGAGGNIGVSVGDDGIVIVDDQFAALAPKIKEALKAISAKPVKFVINTHYHGDHTGGNAIFGREGTIIATDNARKRLENGTSVFGEKIPPAPKGALPVVTFNDRATIWANGEEIRLLHLPNGHTDGDAVVWFTKSNVVHMGDLFFNGTFPFVDSENGGSVKGLVADLEKVLSTLPDDVKVIPGHGPLSDKPGLRKFADAMKGTWDAVAAGVAAGKTLDQLKSEKVLAQWDAMGQGFIKTDAWIEKIYNEMKK